MFIKKIYEKNPELLRNFSTNLEKVLKPKTNIEDSKKITQTLLNRPISIENHNTFMNETERTIVALLWHENIIDAINNLSEKKETGSSCSDHDSRIKSSQGTTARTSVNGGDPSLENDGNILQKPFVFYTKILDNMCFADYVDRITFQNQIWQFNEMSSLIKTFYNHQLYHN